MSIQKTYKIITPSKSIINIEKNLILKTYFFVDLLSGETFNTLTGGDENMTVEEVGLEYITTVERLKGRIGEHKKVGCDRRPSFREFLP